MISVILCRLLMIILMKEINKDTLCHAILNDRMIGSCYFFRVEKEIC